MKIIITDAHSRKAFDIINILERVYDYDLLLFAPAGYSFQLPVIYGQKVHRLRPEPYPDFRSDFLAALQQDPDEEFIYMPVSEEPTLHFYDLMEEDHGFKIRYLLPEKEKIELARDKQRFQIFCEENGFPVPKSYTSDSLQQLQEEFRPVIAKKKIGAGSVGMKFIEKPEQLPQLTGLDDNEYLIQEYIQSSKKVNGGFYLCKDGEVVAFHGHERIRTFPEKGGVTVFSKAGYNEELKQTGADLLKKLNWNGFAMIEFLHDDQTESWKIIELNPRLWGSVMLAEYCESGLLDGYIRLAIGEKVSEKMIETERYIRWVLPFELISFLKGSINRKELTNAAGLPVCYINFTYSGRIRALLFQLYFTFNGRSIKRFIKKLMP